MIPTALSTRPNLPPAPQLQQQLQQTLEVWRSLHHVAGVTVSVRRAGQAVVDGASGAASILPNGARDRSLTPADSMDIGSVSKTLTAAAVLRLAHQGKLNLDAPLSTWKPSFPEASKITVRMLLNQTSGIPDYDDCTPAFMEALTHRPDQPWSTDQALAESANGTRHSAPGERFEYSNTNYLLLSDIAEQAAGTSLDTVLRSQLGAPAGVVDGDLWLPSAAGSFPATAEPLHFIDTAWRSIRTPYYGQNSLLRSVLRGDGGFLASAPTLATVGEGILWKGGNVLDPASRASMLDAADESPEGYGFGIIRGEIATPGGIDASIYWHNGAVNGYRTMLAHLPERELTVAITTNGTPLDEQALTELAADLVDVAEGPLQQAH